MAMKVPMAPASGADMRTGWLDMCKARGGGSPEINHCTEPFDA